jgi:hypothetical protein
MKPGLASPVPAGAAAEVAEAGVAVEAVVVEAVVAEVARAVVVAVTTAVAIDQASGGLSTEIINISRSQRVPVPAPAGTCRCAERGRAKCA